MTNKIPKLEIIIADDDNSELIREVLIENYEKYKEIPITIFENGKELYNYLLKRCEDGNRDGNNIVLLLDEKMPGMCGSSVLDEIKKENIGKNMVVGYISSYHLQTWGGEILEKPFGIGDVYNFLNRLIDLIKSGKQELSNPYQLR